MTKATRSEVESGGCWSCVSIRLDESGTLYQCGHSKSNPAAFPNRCRLYLRETGSEGSSVVIASADGKRELAQWLRENDPETLAALSAFAVAFGKAQEIIYTHNDPQQQQRLRERLILIRDLKAKDRFKELKELLA